MKDCMKRKFSQENVKNILVIKLRYLGDVVVSTPVFEALRHYYPKASITALVNEGTEAMLTDNPNVDRIFVLKRDKNLFIDLKNQITLIAEIRKFHFDISIELTNSDRGAAYSFLSGAKRRLGYRPRTVKCLDRHLLFNDLVSLSKGKHMVDRYLQIIEHLGHTPLSKSPSLYWKQEDEASCDAILRHNNLSLEDDFVVLHPILKAKYRAWRLEGYAKLCDYIYDTFGMPTVMVCGPSRDEVSFVDKIAEISKCSPINLGGNLSLKKLVALISHATLFIGIDSGPMHMAAAVNTPVAAIFGPQTKIAWGPYGGNHVVIQKEWDCVPCIRKGCNDSGKSRCLDELTVEEVITIIEGKMNSILSHRHQARN
jgi:heptosyltransferase-3